MIDLPTTSGADPFRHIKTSGNISDINKVLRSGFTYNDTRGGSAPDGIFL